MTLQECKDQVARKHYHDTWDKLCPNSNLDGVPDEWVNEAAELYASQFKGVGQGDDKDITEEPINCGTCGNRLTLVRPGSHQCDFCEYTQEYQLRQSKLVNELYARITELEKGVVQKPADTFTLEDMREAFQSGIRKYFAGVPVFFMDSDFDEWIKTRTPK